MPTRTFRTALPVDLRHTLAPLWAGRGDPTMRFGTDAVVRASVTPDGPATLQIERRDDGFAATAWGQGAAWALEHAPAAIGAHDDLGGFEPRHHLVARAHRARPGLRIAPLARVRDVVVPTILAQKVTGLEAFRAWIRMQHAWGEPAPGPHGLRLPPDPRFVAGQPYWAFHRFGIERRRAEIVREACRRIDRLEEAATLPAAEAERRLTALRGIGPWTAGLLRRTAFGDADAVELGDHHVPNTVAWALAGEPRGDDARMLELLEAYRGHRGRVVRVLASAGHRAPAYGPRTAPRDIRHL